MLQIVACSNTHPLLLHFVSYLPSEQSLSVHRRRGTWSRKWQYPGWKHNRILVSRARPGAFSPVERTICLVRRQSWRLLLAGKIHFNIRKVSENTRYLSFSEFEVFLKKIESCRACNVTRQTLVEDWGPTRFDLRMRACAIKDLSLSVEKWWILMWTPRVTRLFEQICARASPVSVVARDGKKVLRNIAVHAVVTTYPKGIFPCCVISYIQVFCFVKHYTCTSSLLKWRLMSRVHIEKPCRGHNLPKGLFVFLV